MKMPLLKFWVFALVAASAALASCGGGGGGSGSGSLPATSGPSATPCPSGFTGTPPNCTPANPSSQSFTFTSPPAQATTESIAVGPYSGTLTIPAGNNTPLSGPSPTPTPASPMTVTISTTLPSGTTTLDRVYRDANGRRELLPTTNNTPLLFVTISAPATTQHAFTPYCEVTLNATIGLALTLPGTPTGSVALAYFTRGQWYQISGPTPASSSVSFPSEASNLCILNYPGYNQVVFALYSNAEVTGAGTTNATVNVVGDGYGPFGASDPTQGQALAGVNVKVEPWVAGATPLPSPQATTNASGVAALNGVPNGHYLLIVGSDSPSDTTRATVHDNVMLTGGNVTISAATLVPYPTYTPPATETGGAYRLAHLDPVTEVPCLQAFNAQRQSLSLPAVVADEWLTENTRAFIAYWQSPSYMGGSYLLTTGNNFILGGDGVCANFVATVFTTGFAQYSESTQTQWFGGALVHANGQIKGVVQTPLDPRAFVDPSDPSWP